MKRVRMTETYITIDTAKLAKEKGFDVFVDNSFVEYLVTSIDPDDEDGSGPFSMTKGEINEHSQIFANNWQESDYSCESYTMYARPSQSVLQEWLRKVKDIIVLVNYHSFAIESENGWFYHFGKRTNWFTVEIHGKYNSYEDALEAGLKDALNRIS